LFIRSLWGTKWPGIKGTYFFLKFVLQNGFKNIGDGKSERYMPFGALVCNVHSIVYTCFICIYDLFLINFK